MLNLAHGNYSMEIDNHGNFRKIMLGTAAVTLPLPYTHYEVNGQPVRLKRVGEASTFRAIALCGTETARLSATAGQDLAFAIKPTGDERIESWSITLAFPLTTQFHLPEYVNIGRKLDKEIPVADFYETKVFYNFLLLNCNGVWMRFLSTQRRVGRMGVHIERHDEMFLLTVTWFAGKDDSEGFDRFAFATDARIGLFGSMEEMMADYDRYLAEEVGVVPRACGRPLPGWVKQTRLFVAIDMMRCYGEIENDYRSVAKIAKELKQGGAPSDTVVHIVGWSAAFDAMYPTYRPIAELGGEAAFREMVKTIHECGFRFSVHVNGCGIDPFHPQIDELLPLVLRDRSGRVRGYKLAEDKSPPSRRIRFHTDEIGLHRRDDKSASVDINCPALCESMVTIGGLGKAGSVAIKINERVHITKPDAALDEYQIPCPMHLNVGSNTIELTAESEVDWSKGWFRVDGCFTPNFVHAISTIPILIAATANPEWISLYCDEIERLVTTYAVDLLYIDYTTFYHPPGSHKLFAALCDRLPDTPFSVEWCDSLEELGWFVFCGGAKQHLVKGSPKLAEISGRKNNPVTRGIEERYGWLDTVSPVCDFIRQYTRFNGGGAFVPVNWAASIYPDHLVFADPSELREILDGAERLNFVPVLHLNYRRYGIDDHAKRYLRDLAGSRQRGAAANSFTGSQI